MNLAIIPPRSMAYLFTYGDWAFCLGQEAIRDEAYRNYFCNCPLPVILDNGAFENDLPNIKDYFALAKLIRPRILILPDVLNDADATDDLHHRSLGEMMKLPDPLPTCLAVPQGETVAESIALANSWAVQQLPFQGLAISFKGVSKERDGLNRTRFLEAAESIKLTESPLFNYVHLLGHENDWRELETLAAMASDAGVTIHSLDTAEPVRHALADFMGEPEISEHGWLINRPREDGYLDLPAEKAWAFHQRLECYASKFQQRLQRLFG